MKIYFSLLTFFLSYMTLAQSTLPSTSEEENPQSPSSSVESAPAQTPAVQAPAATTETSPMQTPAPEKEPAPLKRSQLELYHNQATQLKKVTSELNNQIEALEKLNLINDTSRKVTKKTLPKIEESITEILKLSKQIHLSYKIDKKEASQNDVDFSQKNLKYREIFFNLATALDQAQSSRDFCFKNTTSVNKNSLDNFNADSITRLKGEMSEVLTELRFYYLTLNKRFQKSWQDFSTSPIPLLAVIFKSLFLLYLFNSWFKWLQKRENKRPSTWLWYSLQLSPALKKVLMVYIIATPIYTLFTYPDIKIYIKICYVYVAANLVINICNSLASRRNYTFNQVDKPELRQKTLKIIVGFLALIYVFKRISLLFLEGCWMIQSWMYWLLVALFIAASYHILKIWKTNILQMIDEISNETSNLKKIKGFSNREVYKIFTALLGGIYFFLKGTLQWILITLSNFEIFRPMMASFLTLKAIRPEDDNAEGLKLIDEERYIPADSDILVNDYAAQELDQIIKHENRTGMHLITGEKGLGKTTFLKRLEKSLKENTKLIFHTCDHTNAESFIERMQEIVKESKKDDFQSTTVLIDDFHHIFKATIGGFEIVDRFIDLVRTEQDSMTWYVSINNESWQVLKRIRAKKILFESVTKLPKWDMPQLQMMISSRIKNLGMKISFQGLVIPRHLDSPQIDGRRKKDLSYYRILRDYSEGNPSVALYCFNLSLYEGKQGDVLEVRLFNPPSLAELESMPALSYFILRTIVQMAKTNRADLKDCAAEKSSLVDDSLHLLLTHGFIKEHDGFYKIATRWFRPVMIILQRQHLLSK
ncbi:hypothetical protein LNTAR_17983 [Lentisphaera araneosa HTCC2155]|uniref:ORC1/DEAH AAA+ ATPase domain-containing protein n=1 Tax=Lentisphaera araneosa HTCC2155 TaxID=313628 RepID=A6DFT5_9BACT|nr:AAA family ATPase [Lentisphaera araneosa]EDM29665.1 hypothetical protein LNTAR_17983 [Lentisphaera araneosa HTCC2155]